MLLMMTQKLSNIKHLLRSMFNLLALCSCDSRVYVQKMIYNVVETLSLKIFAEETCGLVVL